MAGSVYLDDVGSERSRVYCEDTFKYSNEISAGQIVRHLNNKIGRGETSDIAADLGTRWLVQLLKKSVYVSVNKEDETDLAKTLYRELEKTKADPDACRSAPAHVVLSLNKMLGVVQFSSVWDFIRQLAKRGREPSGPTAVTTFLSEIVHSGLPIGVDFRISMGKDHVH